MTFHDLLHLSMTFHDLRCPYMAGAALNSVAWLGLRAPSILWTYSLSDDPAVLDAYFQQHLLSTSAGPPTPSSRPPRLTADWRVSCPSRHTVDVYPMAPMPKNDHSIKPGSAAVERAYEDYAPLFEWMHGARWLLTSRPVSLSSATHAPAAAEEGPGGLGLANVFTLPRASEAAPPPLLVAVMLADATQPSNVTLRLNLAPAVAALGWPPIKGAKLRARFPGGKEAALGEATSAGEGRWEAQVPIVRGCALVKVALSVE